MPLFPFGFDLSYTSFSLTNTRLAQHDDQAGQYTFTVDVTNTGQRAGAEVVQLYISDLKSSLPRPVKELKAFKKVFLQPGETQTVCLTIDRQALSFYDDRISAWTAEPGTFAATIATSAAPQREQIRFHLH